MILALGRPDLPMAWKLTRELLGLTVRPIWGR
jgi:hypothetical protein